MWAFAPAGRVEPNRNLERDAVMCGIAGIMSLSDKPVRVEEVRSMCDAMIHRGPDDEGFHVSPGIGIGMRRLSIIDLETGQQPVSNEDGTIWVVFNGEIYNFKE